MRISDWSSDVCSSDLRRSESPGRFPVNFDQIVAAARQVGTLAPRASYWSFSWHETNCPVSEDGRGCTCTPEVTVQPLHADVFIEVGMHGELVTMSRRRSEEHTSELQSLMRTSYAVFCLKKKKLE